MAIGFKKVFAKPVQIILEHLLITKHVDQMNVLNFKC